MGKWRERRRRGEKKGRLEDKEMRTDRKKRYRRRD